MYVRMYMYMQIERGMYLGGYTICTTNVSLSGILYSLHQGRGLPTYVQGCMQEEDVCMYVCMYVEKRNVCVYIGRYVSGGARGHQRGILPTYLPTYLPIYLI